jgi:hypothetical protein
LKRRNLSPSGRTRRATVHVDEGASCGRRRSLLAWCCRDGAWLREPLSESSAIVSSSEHVLRTSRRPPSATIARRQNAGFASARSAALPIPARCHPTI